MLTKEKFCEYLEEEFNIYQVKYRENIGIKEIKSLIKNYQLNVSEDFFKRHKKHGRPKGIPMPEYQRDWQSEKFKGEGNPFYGKNHTKQTKDIMSKNHADFTGDNNPFKKSLTDPIKRKAHSKRCKDMWNNRDKEWREKFSEKLSNSMANSKQHHKYSNHKHGYIMTDKGGKCFFRSSWEKYVCEQLDETEYVTKFELEPFCIKYTNKNGMTRTTRLDFIIYLSSDEILILEVKPIPLQDLQQDKIKGQMKYCLENNIQYSTFDLVADEIDIILKNALEGNLYVTTNTN